MLKITIPASDSWDEVKQEFIIHDAVVVKLEHSLVSISKWESEFEKPFLTSGEKTTEEVMAYVRAMILKPKISPEVFSRLTEQNISEINAYIEAKRTATWFADTKNSPKSREVITSELIYYWLIAFEIPFETQKWHLNRLLTLIRVCNVKREKPKKMSHSEIAQRNRDLNAERKKKLNTTG